MTEYIFLIIFGYLLGSIPFGLIISKLYKLDIREYGSGNIGGTNVARIMGKKLGILTIILDGLKGIIPLYFLDQNPEHIKYIVGFSSIMGHIFPIWLKFQGGKGVATAISVILFLNIKIGILLCVFWLSIFYIFKISSLASIFSFILITIYGYIFSSKELYLFLLLTSAIVIARHKSNIINLINNNENKFK